MAHHIYTTKAFVLKTIPISEANSLVFLFTQNLGLIPAVAQGSRLLKSKLRYALQPLNLVDISLVRGKTQWRITNAVTQDQYFYSFEKNKRIIVARALGCIDRFVGQEEKHPEIFETLYKGIKYLRNAKDENLGDIEAVILFRMLYHLGYIAPSNTLLHLLEEHLFDQNFLSNVQEHKKTIISSIQTAFQESQLDT